MADNSYLTAELAARGIKALTSSNIDVAGGDPTSRTKTADLETSLASALARIQGLENRLRVAISGTPPTVGQVGSAYSFTPTVMNGSGTKTFTLSSGTLLGGLSFSTATGAITGSPTVAGTMSNLVITVTDSTGSASTTATTVAIASSNATGATFAMTQLATPDMIYQRDTETGGPAGKGVGKIPVTLNVTTAGAIYARLRDAEDGTTILQDRFLALASAPVANGPVVLSGIGARLAWFYIDIQNSDGSWAQGTTKVGMGDWTMMGSAQSLGVNFIVNSNGTFASLGITPPKFGRALAYTAGDGSDSAPQPLGPLGDGTTYTGAGAASYLNTLISRTGVNQGFAGTPINGSPTGNFSVGGSQEPRLKNLLSLIGGFAYYMTFIGHTDSTQTRPWGEYRCNMSGGMDICASRNSRGRNFQTVSMSIPTGTDPNNNWGSEAQKNRIRGFTADWVKRDAAADCTRAVYAQATGVTTVDGVHENNAGGVTIAKAFTDALLNGSNTSDDQYIALATEGAAIVRSGPDPLVFDTGNEYPQALLQSYFGYNKTGNGGTGIITDVMQCYFTAFQAGGILHRTDAAYWFPQSDGSIKSHTNVASAAGVLPLNKWCTVAFTTLSEDLFGTGAARTEVWVDGVLVVTMAHTSMTPGTNIASADHRSFNGGTSSQVISSGLKTGKVARFNKHTLGKMPAGQLTGKESRLLAAYPLNGSLAQIVA